MVTRIMDALQESQAYEATRRLDQQVQGIPTGWRPAPQATNLACYVVERDWVEETSAKGFACRYIDDLFTAGVPLPPQERYGMEYKVTSDNPHSVVYIGVRVTTSNDRLRTLVHDREL